MPVVEAAFGEGADLIHFFRVNCTGIESALLNCSNDRSNDNVCFHSEDAGVRCQGI